MTRHNFETYCTLSIMLKYKITLAERITMQNGFRYSLWVIGPNNMSCLTFIDIMDDRSVTYNIDKLHSNIPLSAFEQQCIYKLQAFVQTIKNNYNITNNKW